MPRRVIAHLDLDAFYATVELQRRPELRGKPVVVGGKGPRSVVTTASYEARKFGVGSAMPMSRALRQCPNAIVILPDFEAYRSVSKAVMTLVRAAAPQVQVLGLDEAFLDLTELEKPIAAMRALVADIKEQTGMTASVGIGPNKVVAKVCSDAEKPAGFVVHSREQACERFAGQSPGLVPGIGPKTVERLAAMGFTTLGQLAAADPAKLAERFGGNQGPWLVRRAQFHGGTELETARVAVSESRETTFDVDLASRPEQEAVLHRLTEKLCEGLKKGDRRGRTIAIKVRLDDWTTITRARTIGEATNDPARVASIACALLREYDPPRPVRLLGVRMASFAQEEAQLQLAV